MHCWVYVKVWRWSRNFQNSSVIIAGWLPWWESRQGLVQNLRGIVRGHRHLWDAWIHLGLVVRHSILLPPQLTVGALMTQQKKSRHISKITHVGETGTWISFRFCKNVAVNLWKMKVGSVFTGDPPADPDAAGDQIRPELVTSPVQSEVCRPALAQPVLLFRNSPHFI